MTHMSFFRALMGRMGIVPGRTYTALYRRLYDQCLVLGEDWH
jgi:hypothetical protein